MNVALGTLGCRPVSAEVQSLDVLKSDSSVDQESAGGWWFAPSSHVFRGEKTFLCCPARHLLASHCWARTAPSQASSRASGTDPGRRAWNWSDKYQGGALPAGCMSQGNRLPRKGLGAPVLETSCKDPVGPGGEMGSMRPRAASIGYWLGLCGEQTWGPIRQGELSRSACCPHGLPARGRGRLGPGSNCLQNKADESCMELLQHLPPPAACLGPAGSWRSLKVASQHGRVDRCLN